MIRTIPKVWIVWSGDPQDVINVQDGQRFADDAPVLAAAAVRAGGAVSSVAAEGMPDDPAGHVLLPAPTVAAFMA